MALDYDDLEIPEYAVHDSPDYDRVVYPRGGPLFYRFDGKNGFFYKGADAYAETLWIRPFDIRPHHSARWGRQKQHWLDVAFVDESNIVSIISFNKDSRSAMLNEFAKMEVRNIKYHATRLALSNEEVKISLELEDGSEEEDLYHIVKVDQKIIAARETVAAIDKFIESGQFEWILPGEIE
jgi:hypothetical protein